MLKIKRLFVSNVGTRDLDIAYTKVNEKDPPALVQKLQEPRGDDPKQPNIRKWSGVIESHLDLLLEYLSAPILNVALNHLVNKNDLPDHVILVGTKQDKDKCSRPGSLDTGLRGNLLRFLRYGRSFIRWEFE